MVREVAFITISAVLFVQMGLSGAIQKTLHFHSDIASCPKCMAFWGVLAYCIATRCGVVISIAASFLSAYAALWIALLYDALASLYNYLYEQLYQTTTDTEGETDSGKDENDSSPGATDAVS